MTLTLIMAGQELQAGTGAGQLSQYYGASDTASNTFTSATQGNLCTPYTIPANEAYAGAAYELSCAGFGVWGSTQEALAFQMVLGAAFGTSPTVGSVAFTASLAFQYSLTMRVTCTDGVNQWWGDLSGSVVESAVNLNPGAAATNAVAIAAVNTSVHAATVSSSQTAVIQAKWAGTTGAPTITNTKTTWRKVA